MISVIIPLYNIEKYITQCLKSLENQVYKDFELIIVDDGSTDNSAYYVNEFKKTSKLKIKIISQKNAGVSAARNTGLDIAAGKYICFVDSDDMVSPKYLSEMAGIIEDNKCDLVICRAKPVPEDWDFNIYAYEKKDIEIMNSHESLRKYLFTDIDSGVFCLLVKREIIYSNSLRFSKGYHYGEDMEMMWKIITHSNIIAYDKTELYIYRIRSGSAMSAFTDKRMHGMKLIQGLEKYFKEVRPEFSKEFNKYGTARWVWGTSWQTAAISKNYKSFTSSMGKYSLKRNMRKLITFPKLNVSISALIYCLSPFLYYSIIKIIGRKKLRGRQISSGN